MQPGDPLLVITLVQQDVVPSDGDHVIVSHRDERHSIDVVDVGEMTQLVGGQVRLHLEESPIDALRADALEERVLSRGVFRLDRSEVDRSSVAEQDVELEFAWVFSH
jgi:hypothetical protein